MKKLIFTTVLAALAFGINAQDQKNVAGQDPTTTTTTAPSPTAPEITFETDVHDFGTLQKGAPCEYEFKFKNTGKEPLLISNAQASCGCTVPQFPKEPIMPGQGGIIKVKYDSNRVGAFTKTVNVTSNAKNSPKIITIKGKIDAPPQEEQFPGNNTTNGAPTNK